MNIIPNDQRILMVDNRANTTYGGSAALQAMQQWYVMGDLAISSSSPLSFTWTKKRFNNVTEGTKSIGYYELGINFNNLVMEEGVKYTLLLDRYKPKKKSNLSGKEVRTRYAHEPQLIASIKERFSEIVINSPTGQFFDFKPHKYFVSGIGNPTGFSPHRSKTIADKINFVNLGFRIRIEKNGTITETGILGTIAMSVRFVDLDYYVISYARPNS
jgi:hypothetical protein